MYFPHFLQLFCAIFSPLLRFLFFFYKSIVLNLLELIDMKYLLKIISIIKLIINKINKIHIHTNS